MADLEHDAHQIVEFVSNGIFEIAGDDQLRKLRSECEPVPETDEARKRLVESWSRFLRDTKVRIGTLLKTDHLSFLLGAGVSKDAGGVLLGKVPLEVESQLLERGAAGSRLRAWLKVFYLAARRLAINAAALPADREGILARKATVEEALNDRDGKKRNECQIAVGFEDLLSLLYRWHNVLSESDSRLRLDGAQPVAVTRQHLEACLAETMSAFVECCSLPRSVAPEAALLPFNEFLKKILTRPLNLRRTALFTLNYDLLVEKAADGNGVVLLDGFVGTDRRIFRPEAYDHDLYFPGDTTEGRVHRLDRVMHLYKLHGSINWVSDDPSWDNPYGVSVQDQPKQGSRILVYPTPAKYGETLGMPYAELFRRFAGSVVRPQSTLVVIGCGFGDPHVNTIIRQALAIPSFTLVVVDPSPPDPSPTSAHFVAQLRSRKDSRAWVLGGATFGTYAGFVDRVLPDLHDQEVMRKVIETHRALGARSASSLEDEAAHAE